MPCYNVSCGYDPYPLLYLYIGKSIPLSTYKSAKVILVVNVASNCGYTYTNYRELNDLYDRYKHRGLEILAFPCNQFGEQEPLSDADIHQFVANYGVSFPVLAKIDVNGPTAHPVYTYLREYSDHSAIGWNFAKFIVVNGRPVKRFASKISPKKIESELLPYLTPEEGVSAEL
jgi:glutathione peroxidase